MALSSASCIHSAPTLSSEFRDPCEHALLFTAIQVRLLQVAAKELKRRAQADWLAELIAVDTADADRLID